MLIKLKPIKKDTKMGWELAYYTYDQYAGAWTHFPAWAHDLPLNQSWCRSPMTAVLGS